MPLASSTRIPLPSRAIIRHQTLTLSQPRNSDSRASHKPGSQATLQVTDASRPGSVHRGRQVEPAARQLRQVGRPQGAHKPKFSRPRRARSSFQGTVAIERQDDPAQQRDQPHRRKHSQLHRRPGLRPAKQASASRPRHPGPSHPASLDEGAKESRGGRPKAHYPRSPRCDQQSPGRHPPEASTAFKAARARRSSSPHHPPRRCDPAPAHQPAATQTSASASAAHRPWTALPSPKDGCAPGLQPQH